MVADADDASSARTDSNSGLTRPTALPERVPGAALAVALAEWPAVDLWLLLRRFLPDATPVFDSLAQIAAGPATMEYAGS